jgi:predicted AlkP superfamily phosphohydrolase/phosphomutase
LNEHEVDLLFAVFSEPHWAGHLFWHLTDEHHPEHEAGPSKAMGNMILNVYREFDHALAEIVKQSPGCTILIFSNTGMGPNYSGIHLVPEVLRRLGLGANDASRKDASDLRLDGASAEDMTSERTVMKVEALLGPKTIQWFKRFVPERLWDTWTRRILQFGCDWDRSRAFAIPNDHNGAIRINLKGREPKGRVAPGPEYDDLCDELISEFGALTNPETGKSAVAEVFRPDREYGFDSVMDMPDVIVKWAGDAPIRALASPRIGTVHGDLRDKRTGAHTDFGFLLAAGAGIKEGQRSHDGHILDIAPTILYLMGEPVPKDMDGKILLDIVSDRFKVEHSPEYI